jgi:hypothetical protein
LARSIMAVLLLGLACFTLLAASSSAATDSNARVLGGTGTVQDPLRIQASGQVGLTGLIDSLLPFRGLPAVQIEYSELAFAIPGVNDAFIGRPWLAFAFLATAIIATFLAALWLALAFAGRRIKLVKLRR